MFIRAIPIGVMTILGGLVTSDFEHETSLELVTNFGLVALLVGMLAFVVSSAINVLRERRPPGT